MPSATVGKPSDCERSLGDGPFEVWDPSFLVDSVLCCSSDLFSADSLSLFCGLVIIKGSTGASSLGAGLRGASRGVCCLVNPFSQLNLADGCSSLSYFDQDHDEAYAVQLVYLNAFLVSGKCFSIHSQPPSVLLQNPDLNLPYCR